MKTKQLLSLGLLTTLLCSCAPRNVAYDIDEYKTDIEWKDDFTVCQLNDLHLSTASNLEEEFEYFNQILRSGISKDGEQVLPDFIVLDGDTFMDANREIVDRTIDFFDSLNIPFALTYGNHDMQGFYSSNYINRKMLEATNAVYKNPNSQGEDNVFGLSNYFVNLKDGDDLKWKLIFMDSNSYFQTNYDIIHDDQIDWYEKVVLESSGFTEKPNIIDETTFTKSLLFFHIPTPEFKTAITDFKENHQGVKSFEDQYCDVREGISSGENKKVKGNIIDTIGEYQSTVSVGVGHDHINNTDLKYETETGWPLHLIYGMKSSRGIYHDPDIIGATFYTLRESKETNIYGNDVYFGFKMVALQYGQDATEGVTIWSTID